MKKDKRKKLKTASAELKGSFNGSNPAASLRSNLKTNSAASLRSNLKTNSAASKEFKSTNIPPSKPLKGVKSAAAKDFSKLKTVSAAEKDSSIKKFFKKKKKK